MTENNTLPKQLKEAARHVIERAQALSDDADPQASGHYVVPANTIVALRVALSEWGRLSKIAAERPQVRELFHDECVILRVDGTSMPIAPSFDAIKAALGGAHLVRVRMPNCDDESLVDEDGLVLRAAGNLYASAMLGNGCTLVGDVALIPAAHVKAVLG